MQLRRWLESLLQPQCPAAHESSKAIFDFESSAANCCLVCCFDLVLAQYSAAPHSQGLTFLAPELPTVASLAPWDLEPENHSAAPALIRRSDCQEASDLVVRSIEVTAKHLCSSFVVGVTDRIAHTMQVHSQATSLPDPLRSLV